MRIGNVSSAGVQSLMPGAAEATDAYSKSLENQIKNAQKQLQELSANMELSAEDKMKKRQEITQEINNLQNQLRQHEIELRKQAQQKQSAENNSMVSTKQQECGTAQTGMSDSSVQAIISADATMKQAQVQGSVKTNMEDRAGVLRAEIKRDGGKTDTRAKEAELTDAENKAADAANAQIRMLAEADKNMQKASKEDAAEHSNDKKASDETEDKKSSESLDDEEKVSEKQGNHEKAQNEKEDANDKEAAGMPAYYTRVDIRL